MPSNNRRGLKRRYTYALFGLLLGTGAPLGWLFWRALEAQQAWLATELSTFGALYAYMTIGTVMVFSLFGFILGKYDDELVRRSDDIRDAYENATTLAMTDSLTGIGNARRLHDQLLLEVGVSQRYGTPLSCLMIDIDDFKKVNDAYGHPFGDGVLEAVAKSIHDCVRQVDISGRLGGEEFLVIMRQTPTQAAFAVAERIREAVQRFPVFHKGEPITVTVSIGLATLPASDIDDKSSLLRAADEALYRAKRSGKNRTMVHEPVSEKESGGPSFPRPYVGVV